MKTVEVGSLGFDVKFEVVDSAAEFDKAAGTENACVDCANSNMIYRAKSGLPTARKKIVEAIAAITGVPVADIPTGKKDDKGVALTEKEADDDYIKRVRADKGMDEDTFYATYQPQVAEKVGVLKLDYKQAERKAPQPKKLPADYLATATRVFTNGNQEKWAKTCKVVLTGDREKDIIALGWGIRAWSLEQQKLLASKVE